jgi:GntR family transcriptional regulator/MocR family aminotransferase
MPLGRWIFESLRDGILDGRLRPGTRLPSTRELAQHYGVARGTVVEAFDELKWQGYLESRVGSGTWVAKSLPDDLFRVARPPHPGAHVARKRPRTTSAYGRRVEPAPYFQVGPARAFRANQPALDLFPVELWAQITSRRLRRSTTDLLLSCDALGFRPLREAVADYLATSRGAVCVPEQVVIVSGVQEALDMTARLLLDPGDRVAVEDPGYDGAQRVFAASGAALVRLSVDEEGAVLDPKAAAGARLVYLTPAHQSPLGVAMSLPRRLAWLEWAAAHDAAIFEDDYDSEFRYSGRPLPALQGLDRRGQVLLAGSFSKVLFPSLRLSYLVVPEDLVDRFAAVLSLTRRHVPLLEQAVLAEFISGGHFGRHIRRMREVYAERLGVLLETAEASLAGWLEISDVEAGLQTVGWLTCGLDGEQAANAAARRQVVVSALPPSARRLGRDGIQLGFAAFDPTAIRRGVHDLAAALEEEIGRAGLAR